MELIIIKLFLAILVQKCVTQETSSTDLSSSTLPTTTSIPILYLNGNNITWNPSSTQEVQIECDLGYKITATIVECRIDGVNLGYARISSGRETENLMFTYNVTNKPSYFFNTNKLNAAFSGTGTMTVIFSRVGEPLTTTTTEISTSTIYLPTATSAVAAELVVHLTGINPLDYRNKEVLDSLRDAIKRMAIEYCETEHFELAVNITISNVQIRQIVECSSRYPTCASCVKVTFAVPVNLKEDPSSPWSGYQLNDQHLKIMWDRLSSKYITDGISECPQEHINSWVKWQIVLIAVCTALFLVFLLIFRCVVEKLIRRVEKQNRNVADKPSYQFEDRMTQISLPPHYLQETPALFESTYSMFNPAVGSTNPGFERYEDDFEDNKNDDLESESSIIEESGA